MNKVGASGGLDSLIMTSPKSKLLTAKTHFRKINFENPTEIKGS